MKSFITLTFLCLIASTLTLITTLTKEQRAQLKADLEECVKRENVSAADADRINKWMVKDPSDNMKCVSACYLEKVGAFKDNKLLEENILENLTPIIGEEKTIELLQRCKDVKDADRCAMGFKIFECVLNYKPLEQ